MSCSRRRGSFPGHRLAGRHRPAEEARVPRAIHFTRAACAQRSDDFVWAQPGAHHHDRLRRVRPRRVPPARLVGIPLWQTGAEPGSERRPSYCRSGVLMTVVPAKIFFTVSASALDPMMSPQCMGMSTFGVKPLAAAAISAAVIV